MASVQYATPSAFDRARTHATTSPARTCSSTSTPMTCPRSRWRSAPRSAAGRRPRQHRVPGAARRRHAGATSRCGGSNLLDDPAIRGVVVNLRDVTERRRVAEQQAAVAALGQWALSGTALPELLDAAAALVARTLDLPLCGVFELLPGAEELRLVAGVGWEPGAVGVVDRADRGARAVRVRAGLDAAGDHRRPRRRHPVPRVGDPARAGCAVRGQRRDRGPRQPVRRAVRVQPGSARRSASPTSTSWSPWPTSRPPWSSAAGPRRRSATRRCTTA